MSMTVGCTRGQLWDKIVEQAQKNPKYYTQPKRIPALMEKQLGTSIPKSVNIKVLEETSDTYYIVLPAFAREGAELSDSDLEKVAGGGTVKGNASCDSTTGANRRHRGRRQPRVTRNGSSRRRFKRLQDRPIVRQAFYLPRRTQLDAIKTFGLALARFRLRPINPFSSEHDDRSSFQRQRSDGPIGFGVGRRIPLQDRRPRGFLLHRQHGTNRAAPPRPDTRSAGPARGAATCAARIPPLQVRCALRRAGGESATLLEVKSAFSWTHSRAARARRRGRSAGTAVRFSRRGPRA